jgi:GNAT superfamily N-acetyltransferase
VSPNRPADVRTAALTPDTWDDLCELFGPHGAMAGCWCMWWRVPMPEWEANGSEGNRAALRALTDRGDPPPGLLAYDGDVPVGWVSLAPRGQFARLEHSPSLRPVDERPVWSLVCFYVRPGRRARGVALALLDAACAHARAHGADVLEAYPVSEVTAERGSRSDLFMGTPALYARAGFAEVARRRGRPIMRREL